jgi:hypothetical protein
VIYKIKSKRKRMGIDAHRGGGRGRGRGAPHVPSIKIFEKLPHKNAIKHDPPPPLIFSKHQIPPSKEFAKKPKGPTPWIFNYCASMDRG